MQYPRKIIFLVLISIGLLGAAEAPGNAEQTQWLPDAVTIEVHLVPEAVACSPNGYKSQSDGCDGPKLDIKEQNKWGYKYSLAEDLKPKGNDNIALKLPYWLSQALYNYCKSLSEAKRRHSNLSLSERKAAIFLFRFGEAINDLPVNLLRSGRSGCPYDTRIADYQTPPYTMPKGHQHWIDHQNAMALLPSSYMQFTLSAGGSGGVKWVFYLEAPLEEP